MDYKHCCAVDADGYYKAFVLVVEGRVQYYTLKEGESLLDVPPPVLRPHAGAEGLISPRWDGGTWQEGAAPEEAAAWETGHPAPGEVTNSTDWAPSPGNGQAEEH